RSHGYSSFFRTLPPRRSSDLLPGLLRHHEDTPEGEGDAVRPGRVGVAEQGTALGEEGGPLRLRQPVEDGAQRRALDPVQHRVLSDRKSTRLNSSHVKISYAVF